MKFQWLGFSKLLGQKKNQKYQKEIVFLLYVRENTDILLHHGAGFDKVMNCEY